MGIVVNREIVMVVNEHQYKQLKELGWLPEKYVVAKKVDTKKLINYLTDKFKGKQNETEKLQDP